MSSLTQIYNSKVVKITCMTRPMQSSGHSKGVKALIDHEGVLLTLENGSTYLVHIVPETKPVLVSSSQMSSNWQARKSKATNTTVGKIMALAESMGEYSLLHNNCIIVADKIYNSF